MARQSQIAWRDSDLEKLERTISRFNSKIYNVRNRKPDLKEILPDTIKKEEKTKLIEKLKELPRSEFNKKIAELERFSRRGAEKMTVSKTGNKVTKWEKQEVTYKVAQINRNRTRERKKVEALEATSRGEPIGFTRGEMGSERLQELKPKKFNFDSIRGGKEWEKFKQGVLKESAYKAYEAWAEHYKKNYITGIRNVFGGHAADLIEIIEGIPASIVKETFFREQEATIDFIYSEIEFFIKLDLLMGIWERASHEANSRL